RVHSALHSFPTRRSSDLAEVIFDGAPLTPVSVSDTAIVVVSPPHPTGFVDVEVRNPTSLSATLSSAFEYVCGQPFTAIVQGSARSEEHTSELQSPYDLVC